MIYRLFRILASFLYLISIILIPLKPNQFGWGFSGFRFLKPNRTEKFFKNSNRFNRFFFTVQFSRLFFSRFNRFLCFFAHPQFLQQHASRVRSQNFSCLDQKVSQAVEQVPCPMYIQVWAMSQKKRCCLVQGFQLYMVYA